MMAEALEERMQMLGSMIRRLKSATGKALRWKWGRTQQESAVQNWKSATRCAHFMHIGAGLQV